MLNTWQQDGYKESSVKKLITSFEDKENYDVHVAKVLEDKIGGKRDIVELLWSGLKNPWEH